MVAVKPSLIKYGSYLGLALILWLLPTGANLPPLFAIICLISAIVAFVYAAIEGRELAAVLKKSRMHHRASEEIDHHTLATRTHYAMEAITREAEFEFAPVQPAYAQAPVHALPPAKTAQLDPETQAYANQLIELSQEIGWLTPSIIKRKRKGFRQFEPDEIRDFFQQLATFGIGQVRGNQSNLEWIWTDGTVGK